MAKQLSLHLPLQVASARDDLVVTPANTKAVKFFDGWPEWPTQLVILAGPIGAGKTHLCHIWAAQADARFIQPGQSEQPLPDTHHHLVVEGLQQGAFSEAWLFHLINAMRADKRTLVLTSRRWPGDWGVSLPDLQSRLRAAHLVELDEPDDNLLRGVLVKLFADRQVTVSPTLIDYLVVRMERSLACAQDLVDRLDRASLAEGRAVTRKLAAEALKDAGLLD
ncbi:MAG: hypothetical protein AAFO68_03765 [Pseudomonadota bacterium]